jgi:hypothetical protein
MRQLPNSATNGAIVMFLCAMAGVAGMTLASPGAAVPASAQDAPEPTSAFGYRVGEERHYRLGPFDSLASGEAADWSIELEKFIETPDGWNVLFEFTHDRIERIPGSMDAADLIGVNVYGSLMTNLDGFPLEIDFVQELSLAGETLSDSDVRHVAYRWDPDARRFRKNVKIGRRDWDFDFGVARYDYWDEERPRGVYTYMPSALSCLGSSRYACFENDPAFANPGFLSIAFPALMEAERGERDFMFLMPTTVGTPPFVTAATGDWLSRERSGFEALQRYFDETKLKLGASGDVEVGPRTQHAWELEMGAGIDRIWIEPEGRVLRVDLDTTRDNSDERYIRYVFPSEAFTSPNDDPAEECCGA